LNLLNQPSSTNQRRKQNKMIKAKTNILVSSDENPNGKAVSINCYVLSGNFVANKEPEKATRDRGPWNVTHVPTGLKVATTKLLKDTKEIAQELESKWNGWTSNDPIWVKENCPSDVNQYVASLNVLWACI